MTQHQQPYDSSLKSLLEGQATEVIPYLVPEAMMEEELNDEVLKPPLRADRVYRILYLGLLCILHIELETGADSGIIYRLLEYYGILLKKHRKPIISLVIYPFRTTLPESPLRVTIGQEEVLTFHFRILALWMLDARYYLEKRAIGMYPLLPTMQGGTYQVLAQALDEMKAWYSENKRRLAEQILWFDTFLQRTDTVSPEDREELVKKMDDFDSLLEESRFVKTARARGLAEGRAEGRAEGKTEGAVEALQQAVVEIVQLRFPPLTELAQQKVAEVREPKILHLLIKQVSATPDEATTRWLLSTQAA